jgi:predicted ATP-grasp superfamily ATP-dependent carboligase
VKALVTNATEDGGLVAARSLSAGGFEVIGADVRRLPAGMRSRYLTAYHWVGSPGDPLLDEAFIRLIEAVRPDVFLPIGTRGVVAASRHRDALAAVTAINVVDLAAFKMAFDKSECMAECRRLGIACPRVYTLEAALAALERQPGVATIVVKPGWDVGSAIGVRYVRDPAALHAAVEECARKFGSCVIQEFIPGGADAMKTIVLLFTPDSHLAAAFTTQKTRHWPQTGGPTAASRSTADHDLIKLMLPFFEKWRWRGAAEVELKLDPQDGQHKVIEINPRFPGYLRFPWHCGLDLPMLAARAALGEISSTNANFPSYRVGAAYAAPTLFLRTFRDDVRAHGIVPAIRCARTDLRGSAPLVFGMLADPLPLLVRTLRSTRPASGTRKETNAINPIREERVPQR